jgi:hypothetical protein
MSQGQNQTDSFSSVSLNQIKNISGGITKNSIQLLDAGEKAVNILYIGVLLVIIQSIIWTLLFKTSDTYIKYDERMEPTSTKQQSFTTYSYLLFILIFAIFFVVVNYVSSFKDIAELTEKMRYEVYVIFYLIALVFFFVYLIPSVPQTTPAPTPHKTPFANTPLVDNEGEHVTFDQEATYIWNSVKTEAQSLENAMNTNMSTLWRYVVEEYINIFSYLFLIVGVYLFYKAYNSNIGDTYNINYERLKNIILFLAFSFFTFVFYYVNPNQVLNKIWGIKEEYISVIASFCLFFGFIYILILFLVPQTTQQQNKETSSSIFNRIGKSLFNNISFLFIILSILSVIYGINIYPNGLSNDKNTCIIIAFLSMFVLIIYAAFIIFRFFSGENGGATMESVMRVKLYGDNLWYLMKIIVSVYLFSVVASFAQTYFGTTVFMRIFLWFLLFIVVLTLYLRTAGVDLPGRDANSKKNAFFSLIKNLFFYIPCLLSDFINLLSGDLKNTSLGNLIILGITIIIIILYFSSSWVEKKINTDGGKLLINRPIYTENNTVLANYLQLNGTDILGNIPYNYQYSISCWICIHSMPPSTNANYGKATSMLNFGGKPDILYNSKKNTLIITVPTNDISSSVTKNTVIHTPSNYVELDENNRRVVYKKEYMPLQKWNHFVIIYNGGTMDIFMNNELVASSIEISPYMSYDNLTVGTNKGVSGGICNVIYFNKVIKGSDVRFLYNSVKNSTPPINNSSDIAVVPIK